MSRQRAALRIHEAAIELQKALWLAEQEGHRGFSCQVSWTTGLTSSKEEVRIPTVMVTLDGQNIMRMPDEFPFVKTKET